MREGVVISFRNGYGSIQPDGGGNLVPLCLASWRGYTGNVADGTQEPVPGDKVRFDNCEPPRVWLIDRPTTPLAQPAAGASSTKTTPPEPPSDSEAWLSDNGFDR